MSLNNYEYGSLVFCLAEEAVNFKMPFPWEDVECVLCAFEGCFCQWRRPSPKKWFSPCCGVRSCPRKGVAVFRLKKKHLFAVVRFLDTPQASAQFAYWSTPSGAMSGLTKDEFDRLEAGDSED